MSNYNRQEFLDNLSKAMGRPLKTIPDPVPENKIKLPQQRFTELDPTQRCQKFINSVKELGVKIHLLNPQQLTASLAPILEAYQGDIVAHDNPNLSAITKELASQRTLKLWNPQQEDDLVQYATNCGLGIISAVAGFSDGGGIAVEASKLHGRSVSLLPKVSLVVLKTSAILPRIYQYAKSLSDRAQAGERMPSVVNIISGPSSTADIELIKVIGVHGPVEMAILLDNDLNLELDI